MVAKSMKKLLKRGLLFMKGFAFFGGECFFNFFTGFEKNIKFCIFYTPNCSGHNKGSLNVVVHHNDLFSEKNMYKPQVHVSDTHDAYSAKEERILVHSIGPQWYIQQFNAKLSLCQMQDSVAVHHK